MNDRPPRWASAALAALLPWAYRDETLGDLEERWHARRDGGEPRSIAWCWYVGQVIRSIPGAVRLRLQTRRDHESERRMETMLHDIRYALRSMVKTPGFAIVSTITLALAIGVNTSIFSIVNAIVFADLPMQESETVALVRGTNAELAVDQGSLSPADYFDLAERARSYESLSALTTESYALTDGDQPIRVQAMMVSAGLFENWRLPPLLGREFVEGEDQPGGPRVAMLSHGFWQDHFAGRPDVLGETLTLDGRDYTLIGVADPRVEFADMRTTNVILPLVLDRAEPDRSARYLFVTGRLAPGVSQEMATEEARAIGEQLAAEHPAINRGWAIWSAPAMESLIDEDANRILLLLQLTVGMVILIACANVANMLLARASARARELAVRAALGAGRGRLVRQLLTESLVISLAAAALGLGVAWSLNRTLIWISAGTEVVFEMAVLDRRVLLFTLGVSLVAPMLFGLLPALRASATGASATLRDGRSGDGGRAGKRVRGALVTAQVSLALTLMILATLLTRTVVNLNNRPLGYDGSELLTVAVDVPEGRYGSAAEVVQFFGDARQALEELSTLGPVASASTLPGLGFGARRSLEIEGVEIPEGRAAPTASSVSVSENLFEVLGLELLSGRSFGSSDDAESFPVAIVSQEVASRFWPDEDPVGRRFRAAGTDAWVQVVGVVSDVRALGGRERPAANIYVPQRQDTRSAMVLMSRTSSDPAAVAGSVRSAIWSVDPTLPVDPPRSLEQVDHEQRASDLAILTLFVTFAVFALIMAAVGIYGVMAYSVAQRRTEIGLRLAIGAEVGSIRWMVVGQGARLLGLGIVLGLGAAFALSRLLGSLVFGVSTTDPATFIGVSFLLVIVAMAANLVPATRATRLDPATTLRGD